jgi:ubiquinol-cytochrome c reductase subunit 7
MSGITLVNQVKASKFWSKALQPVANAFINASGYRKLGE